MRKSIFLFALTLIASSTSFARDPRCGVAANPPCATVDDRFEAFKKLQANENSYDDTVGNLDLVEQVQKKNSLSLQYTVDNFIYVQQVVGGSNKTAEARDTFSLIASFLGNGTPTLDVFVTAFGRFMTAENGLPDAQEDFRQAAQAAASTSFDFKVLADSLLDLLGAENPKDSTADALSDFDLVILASKKCNDVSKATKDFLAVLSQVGGYQFTANAQDLYRRIYGL